jgi:hypothetical protein
MSTAGNGNLPAVQHVAALAIPTNALDGYVRYCADSGDHVGDLLKVNGKSGRVTFGAQDVELPRGAKLAVLLGQTRAGYVKWQDGKRQDQAWIALSDSAADLEALRATLPETDPNLWQEVNPSGLPRDPYSESVQLPMVRMDNGALLTFASSAGSAVKAAKRLVRNALIAIARNQATTADRVPIVTIEVHNYKTQRGQIFYPSFEVHDWLPEKDVLSLLGKSGNAEVFGVNNTEALNADLGAEPEASR